MITCAGAGLRLSPSPVPSVAICPVDPSSSLVSLLVPSLLFARRGVATVVCHIPHFSLYTCHTSNDHSHITLFSTEMTNRWRRGERCGERGTGCGGRFELSRVVSGCRSPRNRPLLSPIPSPAPLPTSRSHSQHGFDSDPCVLRVIISRRSLQSIVPWSPWFPSGNSRQAYRPAVASAQLNAPWQRLRAARHPGAGRGLARARVKRQAIRCFEVNRCPRPPRGSVAWA